MKKLFLRVILPYLVAILIVSAIGMYAANRIWYSIERQRVDISEHVGDTVVFQNDTVTIIDYSFVHETYTLSNGQKVNTKLYNK